MLGQILGFGEVRLVERFFGLAGITAVVWLMWIAKLVVPSGASKAEVEKALNQRVSEAAEKVAAAKEARRGKAGIMGLGAGV